MSLLLRNAFKVNGLGCQLGATRSYSQVVNVFGRRNIETHKEEKQPKSLTHLPENMESVKELSGHPSEHNEERLARIYLPAKASTQSGTFQLRKWKIEFDNRQRWENPLMGWGSTGDPLSNLHPEFANKEDAIVYCQRNGIPFKVDEPQLINKRIKSYGANFSWNKKTRRTAK